MIYTCASEKTYLYMRISMLHKYVCIYLYICTNMDGWGHVSVCKYVCKYAFMYVYMYVYV